jgi:hypothetical protein
MYHFLKMRELDVRKLKFLRYKELVPRQTPSVRAFGLLRLTSSFLNAGKNDIMVCRSSVLVIFFGIFVGCLTSN